MSFHFLQVLASQGRQWLLWISCRTSEGQRLTEKIGVGGREWVLPAVTQAHSFTMWLRPALPGSLPHIDVEDIHIEQRHDSCGQETSALPQTCTRH